MSRCTSRQSSRYEALLASRLKLKLPGLTGNVSVNLPFILVAVFEALAVGMASILANASPKAAASPNQFKMLFNVSAIAKAVGLARAKLKGRYIPPGLKPDLFSWLNGTAEAMP
jgi:hypothetical protein